MELDAIPFPLEEVKTESEEVMTFFSLPDVLVIHINRAESTGIWNSKNREIVEFPAELDAADVFPGQESRRYVLVSVIEHIGFEQSSGHFVCYKKLAESSLAWVMVSDTTSFQVSEERVLESQPYVLFYERADTSKKF